MKKIIKLLLKNKKELISKKLAKNSGWLPSFERCVYENLKIFKSKIIEILIN